MSFSEVLHHADIAVWQVVNQDMANAFLDAVAPYIRNQFTWAPLYLFLLVFMPMRFGRKQGFFWILGFLLCYVLADNINSQLLKPFFDRTRPCNDELLKEQVRLLVACGGGKSFPSSHAANHFALGTFMSVTLHRHYKWLWPVPLLWALAVGFSQVYVGVHFPADILGGAVVGSSIGLIMATLQRRYRTLPALN